MAFRVEISLRASQHIEEAYSWMEQQNPLAANKWFNGLMTAINSLKDSPRRCPKIPEQDNFTDELRHLIYQRKYRIIFTIQDETVSVVAVRHATRKPLDKEDLENIPPEF